jgi:hypothetical protein
MMNAPLIYLSIQRANNICRASASAVVYLRFRDLDERERDLSRENAHSVGFRPRKASFCGVSSHTGATMDAWDVRGRTGPAAEAGLMSMSMSSPEEELAAVLQRNGCGRNEVVSFTAINKMFQRQAQRLDTQRLQQEQNRQAIESAMEHMQTDLELQKLHSARQAKRLMWVKEAARDMDVHLLCIASERSKTVQLCEKLKRDVDELSDYLSRENPESYKRCKMTSLSDMAANGTDLASLPDVGHIFRRSAESRRSADCSSEASLEASTVRAGSKSSAASVSSHTSSTSSCVESSSPGSRSPGDESQPGSDTQGTEHILASLSQASQAPSQALGAASGASITPPASDVWQGPLVVSSPTAMPVLPALPAVPVLQHGQSAVWAVPPLASCASSGRAWRLWAARYSQGEASPLGAQPLPRVLKLAASKAAHFPAFDYSGAACAAGVACAAGAVCRAKGRGLLARFRQRAEHARSRCPIAAGAGHFAVSRPGGDSLAARSAGPVIAPVSLLWRWQDGPGCAR